MLHRLAERYQHPESCRQAKLSSLALGFSFGNSTVNVTSSSMHFKPGGKPPIVGRQLRNGDMVLANLQVSAEMSTLLIEKAKEESFSHAPL
jgi:hypothetical protein